MSILHYIKLLRGHALSKTWAVMVVRSGLTASYCTVQENQTLKRKCEILSFFQQHSVCCSADGPRASEHLRMSRRQELHLTLLKFNYVPRQNMILSCRVESPENKWVFKGLHLLQTTLLKKKSLLFYYICWKCHYILTNMSHEFREKNPRCLSHIIGTRGEGSQRCSVGLWESVAASESFFQLERVVMKAPLN